MVAGFIGGAAALAGQTLTHFLAGRMEDRKRKADEAARGLAELKSAYVQWLSEINNKSRETIGALRSDVSDEDLRTFVREHHLLRTTDTYFRIRMLEKNPEGAKWIKAIGDADHALLSMLYRETFTRGELLAKAMPAFEKAHAFQEWIYTSRFPSVGKLDGQSR